MRVQRVIRHPGEPSIWALINALFVVAMTWYWWHKKEPDFIEIVQQSIAAGVKNGSRTMRDGTEYTFDAQENTLTLVRTEPDGSRQRVHVKWEAL